MTARDLKDVPIMSVERVVKTGAAKEYWTWLNKEECLKTRDQSVELHNNARRDCASLTSEHASFIIHAFMVAPVLLLILAILCQFSCQRLFLASPGEGAYLAFTWDLEHQTYYKILSKVLAVTSIISMVLFTCWNADVGGIWWAAEKCGAIGIMNMLSLYRLPKVQYMPFDHTSKEFAHAKFKRSWKSMLTENNDEFLNKLSKAVLMAKHGCTEHFQELLCSADEHEHLLRVCTVMCSRRDSYGKLVHTMVEVPLAQP